MLKAIRRLLGEKAPERRVEVVRRDVCRLKVEEWRTMPEMIKVANNALSDPNLRMMLDVLRNSSPVYGVVNERMAPEIRSVMLGRIEGYQMAITDFEHLGTPPEISEMPEATFDPPENDQPEQL